jgi:hypothetical protein
LLQEAAIDNLLFGFPALYVWILSYLPWSIRPEDPYSASVAIFLSFVGASTATVALACQLIGQYTVSQTRRIWIVKSESLDAVAAGVREVESEPSSDQAATVDVQDMETPKMIEQKAPFPIWILSSTVLSWVGCAAIWMTTALIFRVNLIFNQGETLGFLLYFPMMSALILSATRKQVRGLRPTKCPCCGCPLPRTDRRLAASRAKSLASLAEQTRYFQATLLEGMRQSQSLQERPPHVPAMRSDVSSSIANWDREFVSNRTFGRRGAFFIAPSAPAPEVTNDVRDVSDRMPARALDEPGGARPKINANARGNRLGRVHPLVLVQHPSQAPTRSLELEESSDSLQQWEPTNQPTESPIGDQVTSTATSDANHPSTGLDDPTVTLSMGLFTGSSPPKRRAGDRKRHAKHFRPEAAPRTLNKLRSFRITTLLSAFRRSIPFVFPLAILWAYVVLVIPWWRSLNSVGKLWFLGTMHPFLREVGLLVLSSSIETKLMHIFQKHGFPPQRLCTDQAIRLWENSIMRPFMLGGPRAGTGPVPGIPLPMWGIQKNVPCPSSNGSQIVFQQQGPVLRDQMMASQLFICFMDGTLLDDRLSRLWLSLLLSCSSVFLMASNLSARFAHHATVCGRILVLSSSSSWVSMGGLLVTFLATIVTDLLDLRQLLKFFLWLLARKFWPRSLNLNSEQNRANQQRIKIGRLVNSSLKLQRGSQELGIVLASTLLITLYRPHSHVLDFGFTCTPPQLEIVLTLAAMSWFLSILAAMLTNWLQTFKRPWPKTLDVLNPYAPRAEDFATVIILNRTIPGGAWINASKLMMCWCGTVSIFFFLFRFYSLADRGILIVHALMQWLSST